MPRARQAWFRSASLRMRGSVNNGGLLGAGGIVDHRTAPLLRALPLHQEPPVLPAVPVVPPPLLATNKTDILAGSLRAADPSKLTRNFSPGPTSLPRSVIEGVQADLLSVDGCGMSALELSHRSPEFLRILSNTKATLRRVFDVPDTL